MWILILKAIIIGIVEGITEFLPVSSTGHMIIVGHFINFTGEFAELFEVVIQLGAILAVVVLYWNKIIQSIKDIFTPDMRGLKFWINVLVASIPAGILGVLFNDKIKEKLFNPVTVSSALVIGGFLMIFIEKKYRKRNKTKSIDDIKLGQALFVGCFQCLALWPGMSRSASTIMGAWISGMSTVAATEFSFFLAIPVMIGASGVALIKTHIAMTNIEVIALTVGFIVSFLVALVVIEKFIGFLKKRPMRVFAVYRIFIGIIILGLAFAKVITM